MPKSLTQTDLELRKEVAAKFREVVERRFKNNKTRAANSLGITRQRLQPYLEEACTPGADVLALACERWEIELTVGNITLSARQLRKRTALVEPKQPIQLGLFNRPQELSSRNVVAVVRRKDLKTLALALEITLK